MIEVEAAIARICDAAEVIQETVEAQIVEACGAVAAEDLSAPIAVPHFAKSAMDGYALSSRDSCGASAQRPVKLTVLGEICAGDMPAFQVRPGTAVRIMTGAAVPDGYDCVVKQEDTDYGSDAVAIYKMVGPGENYCQVGEDVTEGQMVVPKNTRLTSHHIGILAGLGIARIRVIRPLRVGIISTGNELRKPGEPLAPGQIYSSSSYDIAAQLRSWGMETKFIAVCRDETEEFCEMVDTNIAQVDVLLTTGAVSVGKKDFIGEALYQMGAENIFKGVNMKPGTPIIASRLKGKIILSLSGNPFAALINFHIFFWPLAAKLMQCDAFQYKRGQAMLCEGRMKSGSLRRFLRAYIDDEGVHIYTRDHFASAFSNLTESNCIIDQPAGKELVTGEVVDFIYWGNKPNA